MSEPIRAPRTSFTTRVLVVVVAITCLKVWVGPLPIEATAEAQLPNQGAKLNEQIVETQRTNALLTEIRDILKNGSIAVRAAETKPAR